jgi:hypothetical protein
MERRTRERIFVLSFNDDILAEMKEENYQKQVGVIMKKLFTSIRYKAKKENWAYEIIAVASAVDGKTLKKKRLHIHVYAKSNPSATLIQYFKLYWESRYGLVLFSKEELYNKEYYINGYMKGQAIKYKTGNRTEYSIWEQKYNVELIESSYPSEPIEHRSVDEELELRSS